MNANSTFQDLKDFCNSLNDKELQTRIGNTILTCGGTPDDLQFCVDIEIERCNEDYWESENGEMIYPESTAKDEFEDSNDGDMSMDWEKWKKKFPHKLMFKKGELIIKVHQEV